MTNTMLVAVLKQRINIIAMFVPFVVWCFLLPAVLRDGDRISADSVSYIDCARNIVQGRGMSVYQYDGVRPVSIGPLKLWPPGYPLLIALLMRVGVSGYTAALTVSLICSGLFMLLVGWYFARMFELRVALVSGGVLGALASQLFVTTMCWSEGPYMLLSAACLITLIRASGRNICETRWPLFVFSGVCGGGAWCIRNAAVALLAAGVCYFAYATFCYGRKYLSAALWWVCGWALGGGWLLTLNVYQFGAVSAYNLPAGTMSVWEVVKSEAVAVLGEIIPLRYIPFFRMHKDLFSMGGSIFVVLFACSIVVFAIISWRRCVDWIKRTRYVLRPAEYNFAEASVYNNGLWISVFYVITYLSLLALWKMRYQVAEPINYRYLVPIHWVWVPLAVTWWYKHIAGVKIGLACANTVMCCLLALQLLYPIECLLGIRSESCLRPGTGMQRGEIARVGALIGQKQIVLTDDWARMRVFGAIHAVGPTRINGDGMEAIWEEICASGQRGTLWGGITDINSAVKSDREKQLMLSLVRRAEAPNSPFRVQYRGDGVVVAKYTRNP